ncbi:MAG: hypothetical protein WC479_00615 [Candidatus Izemoplasmatales bacterium]
MPWSKTSEAPANIQELNGVSLTLEQMNWIARVADAIPDKKYSWAIAISKFKKSFVIDGSSWKRRDTKEKEYSKLQVDGSLSVPADLYVNKQDNGRYKIISVSTAALKDREGETFTVDAIDYEIAQALKTGEYPEFRVFHKRPLGIGRVKSMKRVGIFAVEEGESYDDPFSLEVCEKMLSHNTGKWKTSRGFKVLEASGGCPHCGESLLIREKHMTAGFRCPKCLKVNSGFKGSLDDTRFLKTKTFDITVTDVPAVPWTGVAAFVHTNKQEAVMKKEILKKRLLKAGLSEDVIDERLKDITDETLKSFDNVPMAEVLKEFKQDSDEDEEDDPIDDPEDDPSEDEDSEEVGEKEYRDKEQVFVLDPTVLKEFAKIANEQASFVLKELLEGATLETEGDEVTKEIETIEELKEEVQGLRDVIERLLEKDEDRLKELIAETPRGSTLRISRFKSSKIPKLLKPEDQVEDEEEDGEEEVTVPVKKKKELSGKIIDADGHVSGSMTEFLRHD